MQKFQSAQMAPQIQAGATTFSSGLITNHRIVDRDDLKIVNIHQ